MARSFLDDSHLRGAPVEVEFAGLRSDTFRMQRCGWTIGMEDMPLSDVHYRAIGFTFFHPSTGVTLRGETRLRDGREAALEPIYINQAFIKGQQQVSIYGEISPIRHIDATPMFVDRPVESFFDQPFFQTIHVPHAEPLIVEPETVAALLDRIRTMQVPGQADIRARNKSGNRIHAHIMSIAA